MVVVTVRVGSGSYGCPEIGFFCGVPLKKHEFDNVLQLFTGIYKYSIGMDFTKLKWDVMVVAYKKPITQFQAHKKPVGYTITYTVVYMWARNARRKYFDLKELSISMYYLITEQ